MVDGGATSPDHQRFRQYETLRGEAFRQLHFPYNPLSYSWMSTTRLSGFISGGFPSKRSVQALGMFGRASARSRLASHAFSYLGPLIITSHRDRADERGAERAAEPAPSTQPPRYCHPTVTAETSIWRQITHIAHLHKSAALSPSTTRLFKVRVVLNHGEAIGVL